MTNVKSGRLALVVGGGPAPGINGVISAVTIEAIQQGYEVIGFRDGFKWLVEDNIKEEHYVNLTINDVRQIALRGGSFLRTSRTNPTKPPEQMRHVLNNFEKLKINRLVTIGGDDTAYSGSQVYEQANGAIRVAHVPKTIDNDLPLPGSTPTFGFETARHVGVGIVRNLAEDARTTQRWYLIVSMGRAAGHLALGIGKAAAATLTIIPEEFGDRKVTLDEVCEIILGSIIKRRANGRPHGVAVIAEGLLEAIGETGLQQMIDSGEIGRYGEIKRDPFGHIRLGEIEFGRMVKDCLAKKLHEVGLNTTVLDKELGYEMRCADPIPFDAEYTRDLGYGAVKFLESEDAGKFGAVISLVGGHLVPMPFHDLIDPATRRMTTRRVNIRAEGYKCAGRYMLRLNKRDFQNPDLLVSLARVVRMSPEQFRQRFAYLVQHDEDDK
jgi:6-phosphofructokinase 1